MAEPEYPVLKELETKLKLQWIDTNDYLATQRAIIEVTPDHAYLELPRGRKGDKGDPGNAISFQGIVARTSDLPTGLGTADAAKAWVNTATKALHVWNGNQWFTVNNFAGVDADVQRFSQWFAQAADAARTARAEADRAEYWANETIQQVTGDFATQNYVDERTWPKGAVSDADSLRAPGVYRATTATVGLPDGAKNKAGIFEVLPAGASLVTQRFTATGVTQETWERTARDSTSWYSWNRVIPVVQEVIGHVDDVGPGEYFTGFSTEGLPADATTIHGSFEVLQSRTQRTQRFTTWGLNPEVWLRSRQTETNWYPWKLQPKAEVFDTLLNRVDVLETSGGGGPSQGMKEVPLLLTAGVGNSEGAPNGGTYRIIGEWGVPIKRWRICISTRNPRYNMAGATGVSLARVTFAKHAGNGATTGNSTNLVLSNISLSGDTAWKSRWYTAPMEANTEYAFGIEYAGIPPLLEGYGFRLPDGTNPQTQSVTGTATNRVPFDVWIEAETPASTPVIAGVGDSTMVGAGATRELVDSWLGLYARQIGALPVHYAASGDSAYNWLRKLDGYQMSRWEHLPQSDAVIFGLGNNDMNTTTDGLTMAERVEGLIPYIRKYIGSNLYAATVKPRASLTSDEIASRNAYTAWLNGTGRLTFRDVFDFHTPVAIGDLLDPQYDSGDGTHLNDAGYAQLAAAVGTVTTPIGHGALAAYMEGKGQ